MKQYIFEKTYDMDSEEFANLLHLAIGNRSAKEFALLCGVHPSNFTRIKNQAIRRACSPKFLKLIAENADPESGVTIEKLAASNGYTLKEDTACPEPIPAKHLVRKNVGIEADNVSFYARMEHLVFAIICKELIARGHEVALTSAQYHMGKIMGYRPDALIKIRSSEQESEGVTDLLCMEFSGFNCEIHSDQEFEKQRRVCHRVFGLLGKFALVFTDVESNFKPTRFYIVVAEKEAFDIIIQAFGEKVMAFDVAIVLVDTTNHCVVEEFLLPLNASKERKLLFGAIKQNNSDMEFYDKNINYEMEENTNET